MCLVGRGIDNGPLLCTEGGQSLTFFRSTLAVAGIGPVRYSGHAFALRCLGQQQQCLARWEGGIGKQGQCVENGSGRRLLTFSAENGFKILNAYYAHKEIHKYTCTSPGRGLQSLLPGERGYEEECE